MPATGRSGAASQCFSAVVRIGSARLNVVANLSTRRRAVRSSGSTRMRRDSDGIPSALTGQERGEPGLPVDAGKRRLDVGHDRLHLDDKHDPAAWIPREDVDRTALAAYLEGGLRNCHPTRSSEQSEHRFDDHGVVTIQESIELLAVPQDADRQPSTESRQDPFDHVDRCATERLRARCARSARSSSRPHLASSACVQPRRLRRARMDRPIRVGSIGSRMHAGSHLGLRRASRSGPCAARAGRRRSARRPRPSRARRRTSSTARR